MKRPSSTEARRRGFALVPALFLIVVLGALAVVAIRVGNSQQHAVTMGLEESRALAAARAGIEWAAYNAFSGAGCASSTTLSLTEGALNGFTVVVTCASTAFASGAVPNTAYVISSSATLGTYGKPAYVHRVVSGTFTDAS